MNKKLLLITAIMASLSLAGCKSTPQTKREIGQINFDYKPANQSVNTDKTIAIVSPVFEEVEASSIQSTQQSPLMAMMAQQQTQSRWVNFNSVLYSNYKRRLVSSMVDSFNEIVVDKGFKVSGPYSTFDDITYTDKKTMYLAFTPDLEVYIDQKVASRDCVQSQNYCEDTGTIQVSGSLNVKLIEPLTKQAFMSKRINLGDITTTKEYVKRTYIDGPQQGIVSMALTSAIDAATDAAGVKKEPKPYVDNTDKVLADALNEFYANAMAKVDRYVSSEEILSFEKDVETVKELKRF